MAEHFILWGMKILEFHLAKKKGKLDSLLRFNVLFYIVYWKYLWIFGSLTKSIGYLVI